MFILYYTSNPNRNYRYYEPYLQMFRKHSACTLSLCLLLLKEGVVARCQLYRGRGVLEEEVIGRVREELLVEPILCKVLDRILLLVH